MPFEPLRTDEPNEGPKTKYRDLDSQMLAGCSTFVTVSLLSYLLVVWPHLVFQDTYRLQTLALNSAFGLLPSAILGGYATRKFGLAAAGGFVGGALAAAIFLFLRLQQVVQMEGIKDLPQPEFPSSWQYLVPCGWMLAVIIVTGLLIKKEELSIREG
jgi:hypothetical protein